MYEAYNTIENHEWIPKEAFLYFPTGSSTLKQQDDFKMIIRNEVKRLIYEGDIQYLDQEMQKINQFKQFLQKKQIVLDKRWSKAFIYKFLQSTGYDHKKALKEIFAHNEYKADLQAKDFDELRKHVEPFLKQGPFYFNGRDAKFRPIIVCDIAKIHRMKLTDEDLYKCLQYFFQFMYRNMFINGQVENVVGIIDLGFTSPMDLVKPMKMTIGFLQGNYKYKLHALYIIQSTNTFQFCYNLVKHLMREDTIKKINVIQKGQPITQLLETTNKSQLEQRFGGTHPNLNNGEFWPPCQFSSDFSHSSVKTNIISQAEYKQMYLNGLLAARKIYLDFIEESSQDSNQIPLLNERKPTENFLQANRVKEVETKQKNIFERAIYRITCHSCFGSKQIHIKKSRKHFQQ